ncbi:hypothetical protein ACJ72_07653, partial [Emergomyces africanus]
HPFDYIGALTLDSDNENWVFKRNRPLSVLMNEQTLAGLNPCRYVGPNQVFHSTMDYTFMIHQAMLDDFHLRRDSIHSELDARAYLYGLYNSRQFLMQWVQPEHNHGPFVLMHGDLRSSNILVDDDLNIVSVLDWEWSHTIPLQMFLPPPWLTGFEVPGILRAYNRLAYDCLVDIFRGETADVEYQYCRKPYLERPLFNLWKRASASGDIFIGLGLRQPLYFGNVYDAIIDHDCYKSETLQYRKRLDDFFNLEIHKPEREAVQRKLDDLKSFAKECDELGVQRIVLDDDDDDDYKPSNSDPENQNQSAPLPLGNYFRELRACFFRRPTMSRTHWAIGGTSLGLACCFVLVPRWKMLPCLRLGK